MSSKRSKKDTTKNNKKAPRNKEILKLKPGNGAEIPAKTAYAKATKYFKINDIDINEIRFSDKKLYDKVRNSYKYYVFYEHDNVYIPIRIILKDFVGYYNVYKNTDAEHITKKLNFKLGDDCALDKIIDMFERVKEKLQIDLESSLYEDRRGERYLKTKVSNGTFFKDNITPKENAKYVCRVILQIQSVYYSMEDKDDVKYYPQILLEKCVYRLSSNNTIIDSEFEFSDNEPDTESDSELEFNEDTV